MCNWEECVFLMRLDGMFCVYLLNPSGLYCHSKAVFSYCFSVYPFMQMCCQSPLFYCFFLLFVFVLMSILLDMSIAIPGFIFFFSICMRCFSPALHFWSVRVVAYEVSLEGSIWMSG